MKTPRLLRGVSPQPQLYTRGATPMINGHEDSSFNTNPASTRAAVSLHQDFNPLNGVANGSANLHNYSEARMAAQASQREVFRRRRDISVT